MAKVRLSVGGDYDLAFLSCESCVARWEINLVPIDQPPWSVVRRKAGDRFRCRHTERLWRGPSMGPLGHRGVDENMHEVCAVTERA